MATKEDKPLIVVKRIKKVAGGHHGGAWKIAYADFVTAMMAFFLLMWLLASVSKEDLKGISEYFKMPIEKIVSTGPSASGSSGIFVGGGKDLTRKDGEVSKADDNSDKAPQRMLDEEGLKQLKARVESAIEANPQLQSFKKQVLIDITEDGLRIQIVDNLKRPMFALSDDELQPYARDIMKAVGKSLNGVENKLTLSGHTDAHPFPNKEKSYSNWELSADRANAARRELVNGGMDETKLMQVTGLSSAVLYDKTDPLNPINRRISIIVMNKKAQERIERNASIEAGNADAVQKGIQASAPGIKPVAKPDVKP
ncbi:flagellar motor protein MotB [Polynucleobacter sp. CS-Odin-A6]|uniref:flagellar motor protein MotB n=1 Tax=Polynucleobacter sp. CS-Odin-A6 TaxID=2689106 RepID=UPI001C0D80E2|nr:flagellar motor protein MotB [Polynucleobacter sp. CS-Odin-A6]MBU3621886.1 flagellar motor protein MotB [Polynucleobacter sp. CS-Odin-A6]